VNISLILVCSILTLCINFNIHRPRTYTMNEFWSKARKKIAPVLSPAVRVAEKHKPRFFGASAAPTGRLPPTAGRPPLGAVASNSIEDRFTRLKSGPPSPPPLPATAIDPAPPEEPAPEVAYGPLSPYDTAVQTLEFAIAAATLAMTATISLYPMPLVRRAELLDRLRRVGAACHRENVHCKEAKRRIVVRLGEPSPSPSPAEQRARLKLLRAGQQAGCRILEAYTEEICQRRGILMEAIGPEAGHQTAAAFHFAEAQEAHSALAAAMFPSHETAVGFGPFLPNLPSGLPLLDASLPDPVCHPSRQLRPTNWALTLTLTHGNLIHRQPGSYPPSPFTDQVGPF
jgi:hypothetical protein